MTTDAGLGPSLHICSLHRDPPRNTVQQSPNTSTGQPPESRDLPRKAPSALFVHEIPRERPEGIGVMWPATKWHTTFWAATPSR